MPRTFASRIRFLVISLCLGFGLAILVAFWVLSGRQIEATARNDVSLTSGMLSSFIADRMKLLGSLTAIEAVGRRVNALADTDRQTVAAEVGNVLKEARVDAVTITGADGSLFGEAGFTHPAPDLKTLPGIAAALEGPLTASCPASVLQWHARATVVVDEAAAARLRNREYYAEAAAGLPD